MKKYLGIVMTAALLFSLTAGQSAAQIDDDCVDVAGNGYQVCGIFLSFWNDNDAAAHLGNPLSDAFDEVQFDSGAAYRAQYFEHARIERHPDNAGTPYAALLGRLGAEVLQAQGRDWHAFSKSDPGEPNNIEGTGFAIAPEFIDFWTGHGLDLGDAGVSFRESLALFGYPISRAQIEANASGEPVLTQWFERARFELRGGQVVLAPLGAELLDVPGVSDPASAAMLAQVRRATAGYQETAAAQAAGWDLVNGLDHCFDNPGVGAMGVHYINVGLLDTSVDPLMPEAMVYQHGPDGELSFGAVEWIVPADAWDAEGHDGLPEVLGQEFHLNAALGVYVLHAWIVLENPAGVFEDWNPDVSCPPGDDEGQNGNNDHDELAPEIEALIEAVAPYQDLEAAQAAGYILVEGLDHCFDNPGIGAMGIHYINVGLLDTMLDPLQPEAMVYQHGSGGELSLGAVEWIVPAEAWDAEGHDGPPSVIGHELHLNEALGVYVLHAWIFLDNPAGMFEDWNPDVTCPASE